MAPLLITSLFEIGSKVFDRMFPDPAQADAAKLEMLKLQQSGELQQVLGQLEINKVEAASPSIFIGGWRPASGWICNAGLAYTFLIRPIGAWVAAVYGWPEPPEIDTETLLVLLGSLLGIGGLRSYERVKGKIPQGK
jgi:hypothetical protein